MSERSVMQYVHRRVKALLSYFATTGVLIKLVFHVSPFFFIGLLVLTLLNGLSPLATLLVSSQLIDVIANTLRAPSPVETAPGAFIPLLVLLGGIGLLDQLLARLRQATERLYQTRVKNHVQLLIAEKAASLDLAFFENPAFHDQFRNASTEASYRPLLIVTGLVNAASQLVTVCSLAAVLLLWQPWVVPVLVLSGLALFWMSLRFGTANVSLVLGQTPEARKAQYFSMLLTSDTVAKEVRLFGLRDFLLSNLRGLLDAMYHQDRRLMVRQTWFAGAVEPVLAVVRPALVGFTAFEALGRRISIGQFNLYAQSIFQFHAGLSSVIVMLAQLHEHNLFVANLFSFLALQPDVEARLPDAAARPAARPATATPHIAFRHVSFRYPDAQTDVISDLCFELHPGEAVALVGENGAGKTTIVKLLAGLYRPTAGQILIDGADITMIDRDELRAYLSVIFQDYPIYHFSAYENIAVGCIDQIEDRARVQAAAERSGLDALVRRMPHGYDTVLGRWFERGHELSGGQRQLVALTRALARAAPLLVLDEPSAALDIHAERHFFQQLLSGQRGEAQSVLFISHRFSTVRRADRILVLENGCIVEQGAHDDLMALEGRYAEMFTLQAEMYVAAPALEVR